MIDHKGGDSINLGIHKNDREIPLDGRNIGGIYFDEKFIPITDDIIPGVYDWYLISNYGRIYNKYTGNLLKLYETFRNSLGKTYYSVNISTIYGNKTCLVHRLVMDCFYPAKSEYEQKLDINHKDGDKHYNYISYNDINRGNLERATRSENIIHAYNSGLHSVGENNVHSNISNDTAKKIIELLSTTDYTSAQICEIVGNNSTIAIVDSIRKKESWKHLSQGIDFNQRINRLFTEKDIHNFCISFQNHRNDNLSINDNCRLALIENRFEPSQRYVETLRKIYTKKYYKNIISQYNW